MVPWADIFFVMTIIAAIGPIIDYFLLKNQRSKLYLFGFRLWYIVSELKVSRLPKAAAIFVLQIFQTPVEKVKPISWLKTCIISIIYSVSVTLLIGLISLPNIANEFRQVLVLLFVLFPFLLIPFLINVPFDVLSVWFFKRTVRHASVKPGISSILIIVFNAIAAAFLAFICLTTIAIFDVGLGCSISEAISRFYKIFILFTENRVMQTKDDWEYTSGFLAISTFIPILLFSACLLALIITSLLFKAVQLIIMFCLERLLENEPEKFAPFTMISILCSVMILFMNAIQHFR